MQAQTAEIADLLQADKVMKAFDAAKEMWRENYGCDATGVELVWELFKEAADTTHRLPDRERAWVYSGSRVAWPSYLPDEEVMKEIWEAALAALARGEKPETTIDMRKGPPNAAAIDRAELVVQFGRYLRPNSKRKRDWQLLWKLAAREAGVIGMSVEHMGLSVRPKLSRSGVYEMKKVRLGQIYQGLVRDMTLGM